MKKRSWVEDETSGGKPFGWVERHQEGNMKAIIGEEMYEALEKLSKKSRGEEG